jgi:O-succinylbenzoic acid--CoA ligase
MMEKKVLFFGKRLKISEINFATSPFFAEVGEAIRQYTNATTYVELHTSGSTGTPKAIRLNKNYMRASARKTLEALQLNPGDRCLLCLSPKRVGGLMMLVRWLEGDLDLYLTEPQKNPLRALSTEVDFAAMVPYQLAHSQESLHRAAKIIVGGGAVSSALEEACRHHPGLYHTYGMTETISHVALRRFGASYFTALPEVHFAVDARACLIITARHLGIKTLVTNDVVALLDEKRFVWKGRYDHVVNSGGIKLHPEELEAKIGALDFPFFLAGVPDEMLGEKLIAVVATKHTSHESGDLLALISAGLNKYEKPKALWEVEELLYTENGKLKRNLDLYTPGAR